MPAHDDINGSRAQATRPTKTLDARRIASRMSEPPNDAYTYPNFIKLALADRTERNSVSRNDTADTQIFSISFILRHIILEHLTNANKASQMCFNFAHSTGLTHVGYAACMKPGGHKHHSPTHEMRGCPAC